ncbi:MAG: protein kinase [Oscillospiraceae bacterium]|nr:protein kinase [Oscillospiraceae bacterium]
MHSVGMIHRDVAPDNIFVCEDGKIKLLDFGAARVTSTSNEKTLSVILKQGYAPKEQYSGRGNQGAWTDVYAVCATMYRMLTGTTLPDSLSRTEDAAPDVAIPDSAKNALRKGLAVEPEKRTQSAGELLRALQKDLPQSSYAIDPRQFLDFEEKQKKRKRLRILLAAVALILLLAAVAVAVVTAIQKPNATEPSETETEALPVVTEAKLGLQVDFQKMIEEKISDDMEVIRCSEMDYNGDGKKEAFALVAEQESNRPTDDSGVRLIECWFASEKSCEKICSEKETRWYYNLPTDTVILTDDFIAWSIGMGPGPAGGHMCYYYFTVNKSGEPTALIETSDGTLQRFTAADTDFLYCTSEHMIWEESYFRFDEENCRLVEYGGIPITEKQVESLKYGTTMLQRIKEEGQVIHSIYYREAGIININVQNEDQHYGFHTFTVQNGSLDSFGRSGDGYMNEVFIESNYEGLDENYFAGYFDAFSFTVDVSYPTNFPYG